MGYARSTVARMRARQPKYASRFTTSTGSRIPCQTTLSFKFPLGKVIRKPGLPRIWSAPITTVPKPQSLHLPVWLVFDGPPL